MEVIDPIMKSKKTTRKYQPDAKEGTEHFSVTLRRKLVAAITKRAKSNNESRSLTVQKALEKDFFPIDIIVLSRRGA